MKLRITQSDFIRNLFPSLHECQLQVTLMTKVASCRLATVVSTGTEHKGGSQVSKIVLVRLLCHILAAYRSGRW